MGYPGPPGPRAIPPSEASPEELYKMRYMGVVRSAEKPATPFGSPGLAVAALIVAAVVVVGAFSFYALVLGSAHVVVSDVTTTPGTCQANGGYPLSTLLYRFVLTNTGTRNAVAALDFYAGGSLVDTTWDNPVAAGQSVDLTHSVELSGCSVSGATVLVRSATPT